MARQCDEIQGEQTRSRVHGGIRVVGLLHCDDGKAMNGKYGAVLGENLCRKEKKHRVMGTRDGCEDVRGHRVSQCGNKQDIRSWRAVL